MSQRVRTRIMTGLAFASLAAIPSTAFAHEGPHPIGVPSGESVGSAPVPSVTPQPDRGAVTAETPAVTVAAQPTTLPETGTKEAVAAALAAAAAAAAYAAYKRRQPIYEAEEATS